MQKFQNILVIELFVQLYFSLQIRFFVKNSDRDFLDGHLISFESAEKDSSKSASSEYLIFVDFNYKEMFKLFLIVFNLMESDKTNEEEYPRILGQRCATIEFRLLADLLSTSLSFRTQSDSGQILN